MNIYIYGIVCLMFYCRMREASWLLVAGTALGILLPQVASNVFFISIYILYIFILASNLLKDILFKISMGSFNHFPNFEILRCGEGMGVRIEP